MGFLLEDWKVSLQMSYIISAFRKIKMKLNKLPFRSFDNTKPQKKVPVTKLFALNAPILKYISHKTRFSLKALPDKPYNVWIST